MNTIPSLNLFMEPYMTWNRLAWKAGEMANSSAQAIGHRTGKFAFIGAVPGASDPREFTLMGRDKGAAVLKSAQAMATCALLLNQQLATLVFNQMMSASVTLMSTASGRTAGESVERQVKPVRDTLAISTKRASKLSGAAGRSAHSGRKPAHKRVSANAKRAGKRPGKR